MDKVPPRQDGRSISPLLKHAAATALVVGDEVHGDIMGALESAGRVHAHARTLMEALRMVRRHGFGEVILDCRHSATDALELVVGLRDAGYAMPIIVMDGDPKDHAHPILELQRGVIWLGEGDREVELFEVLRGLSGRVE